VGIAYEQLGKIIEATKNSLKKASNFFDNKKEGLEMEMSNINLSIRY